MSNNKKFVEEITSREEDYTKWYTDVVKKAELMDYSAVKGCMILKPRGYAIWENIQKILDKRFKKVGVENVYMPMFIPESLLQKEKDHVEGFAPEVAWVTHGGEEKLQERLCVRPTSETLFCDLYKDIIHSYRDLPITNGVLWLDGRRLQDHFFVHQNFYGRKVILFTQHMKMQKNVQFRC